MWQELNINACINSSVILSIYTPFFLFEAYNKTRNQAPTPRSGGWWLMLICCERKILLAG